MKIIRIGGALLVEPEDGENLETVEGALRHLESAARDNPGGRLLIMRQDALDELQSKAEATEIRSTCSAIQRRQAQESFHSDRRSAYAEGFAAGSAAAHGRALAVAVGSNVEVRGAFATVELTRRQWEDLWTQVRAHGAPSGEAPRSVENEPITSSFLRAVGFGYNAMLSPTEELRTLSAGHSHGQVECVWNVSTKTATINARSHDRAWQPRTATTAGELVRAVFGANAFMARVRAKHAVRAAIDDATRARGTVPIVGATQIDDAMLRSLGFVEGNHRTWFLRTRFNEISVAVCLAHDAPSGSLRDLVAAIADRVGAAESEAATLRRHVAALESSQAESIVTDAVLQRFGFTEAESVLPHRRRWHRVTPIGTLQVFSDAQGEYEIRADTYPIDRAISIARPATLIAFIEGLIVTLARMGALQSRKAAGRAAYNAVEMLAQNIAGNVQQCRGHAVRELRRAQVARGEDS